MNILTIDLEDWFHLLATKQNNDSANWENFEPRVEAMVEVLLQLLKKHDTLATFFVLGWVAERYPDLVAQIYEHGHELGTHSYYHRLVYTQSEYEFEEDLVRSLRAIEKATGNIPHMYRAPGFSIRKQENWAFNILAKNGIKIDASIFPAVRYHGGMPHLKVDEPFKMQLNTGKSLFEFPMSTVKMFKQQIPITGGGYFRLAPLPLLKYALNKNHYNMIYMHPRDFDVNQPVLSGLSYVRKFRSYYGIKGALRKLDVILSIYKFETILEATRKIDWEQCAHYQFIEEEL